MSRNAIVIPILSMFLVSCGETRFAEQYAAQMAEVLKSYQTQVNAKIRAEQDSYTEIATIFENGSAGQVRQAILGERNRRATDFADRLAKQKASDPGSNPTSLTQIRSELRAYAEIDFERSAAIYSRELDAYKAAIASLASLSAEQVSMDQLRASLEALAQPKSVIERLRSAGQFACEVNRNQQLMEQQQRSEELKKKIDAETNVDAKKKLQAQKDEVDAELKKLGTPCKVEG